MNALNLNKHYYTKPMEVCGLEFDDLIGKLVLVMVEKSNHSRTGIMVSSSGTGLVSMPISGFLWHLPALFDERVV